MNYPYIDIYDTTVSVWEDRVDEISFRRRLFDPVIALLRASGWLVDVDPDIAKHYKSLVDTHLMAWRGDLLAKLELRGRVISFEMWQEKQNVSNPNGGRYDSNKRGRMPHILGLTCDLTIAKLTTFLLSATGYPISDRRRVGNADEQIKKWITGTGHYVPELGHARINSEANRTGAGGVRLEHGQRVWFTDTKGRWQRGQAFYSLNNMWLVKFSPRAFTQQAAHQLHATPPADPRRKANRDLRLRRLKTEIARAVEAEDFQRAHVLKTVRDRPAVCTGRPSCPACASFRCAKCGKRRPWCMGADDDKPEYCDHCWLRAHSAGSEAA